MLSYLKTLHPVDSLSLKDLSFKFLVIVAGLWPVGSDYPHAGSQ